MSKELFIINELMEEILAARPDSVNVMVYFMPNKSVQRCYHNDWNDEDRVYYYINPIKILVRDSAGTLQSWDFNGYLRFTENKARKVDNNKIVQMLDIKCQKTEFRNMDGATSHGYYPARIIDVKENRFYYALIQKYGNSEPVVLKNNEHKTDDENDEVFDEDEMMKLL